MLSSSRPSFGQDQYNYEWNLSGVILTPDELVEVEQQEEREVGIAFGASTSPGAAPHVDSLQSGTAS